MSIEVLVAYKAAREQMVQAVGYDPRRVAAAAATLVAHQHALVPGGIEGATLLVSGRDEAFARAILEVDALPGAADTVPLAQAPAASAALRSLPRLRGPAEAAAGPYNRWTSAERAALAVQVAWYAVYVDGLHACAADASLRRPGLLGEDRP